MPYDLFLDSKSNIFLQKFKYIFVISALRKTNTQIEKFIKSANKRPKADTGDFDGYKEFPGPILLMTRENFLEWVGSSFNSLSGFLLDNESRYFPLADSTLLSEPSKNKLTRLFLKL